LANRRVEEMVTFTGRGAELELIGELEYVEEFRPDEQRLKWKLLENSHRAKKRRRMNPSFQA
jgi:hypothetical protein